MNLAACGGLPRSPLTGIWFRAVDMHRLPPSFDATYTRPTRSRYSPGNQVPASQQFPILYLAGDPFTAQFEIGAVFSDSRGRTVPNPHMSYAMLNVHVNLREVFDLTDVSNAQSPLGITAQELTGDWRGYEARGLYTSVREPIGVAPTQELGAALAATGIEGFQTISARVPVSRVLVVFPDNLHPHSSITYTDSLGKVVAKLP